jgi:anthranilate synthase/aminodeoxychorismate synthase-like glutamine amidotransferase
MVLLIDNYDSFTFNLAQYLGALQIEMVVKRNDQITLDEIAQTTFQAVVISPGPCTPKEAGISVPLIQTFKDRMPILGVCLGHQAIGAAFGGEITRAPEIMHGKTSQIFHDNNTVFKGITNPFTATRYHSLIIARASLPAELVISAQTKDGIIMGVRHRQYPVEGVQFHPESILTSAGEKIISNFFQYYLK